MTPFHGRNKVRPRINVTTGNKTFNWLFDTGAAITCMNANSFRDSFGREKNLRALYDNETPTSGRATSSAWPTLGATTLKGGSKIQNLSKKCGKIFFISLKWILMVTSPWLPAKRKLYKTAKVERLTVSNKKWRWSQDLAILETPLQWRLTLWMLELRMLELWMLVKPKKIFCSSG